MALLIKGTPLELREVLLRDKPPSMLALSPKGTVPVLQTAAGDVIEESLEIMCWAIPAESLWFSLADREQQLEQARSFEDTFKPHLDAYKYYRPDADRSREAYRELAAGFLDEFEANLHNHDYLLGFQPQFLDLAVIPFVRQFAAVDRQWFDTQHRQNLRSWLDRWLAGPVIYRNDDKIPAMARGFFGEVWPSR